jgi:hypothetical protein
MLQQIIASTPQVLSPFEWASQHIQLLGWPALLIMAGKLTWHFGRFLVRQELQVEADRVKLSEARDATMELKQINGALLAEWKDENGTLKHLVETMMKLQEDFHLHTREDQLNQEALLRNLGDIKRVMETNG